MTKEHVQDHFRLHDYPQLADYAAEMEDFEGPTEELEASFFGMFHQAGRSRRFMKFARWYCQPKGYTHDEWQAFCDWWEVEAKLAPPYNYDFQVDADPESVVATFLTLRDLAEQLTRRHRN